MIKSEKMRKNPDPSPSEIIKIEDEILAESIKKSREERTANGRMLALIVAVFLIFLAIYHAWIRKTAYLAGALLPALIMILYGGWVIFLAKRDKKRRLLLEQRIGERLSDKGSEFGTQENLINQNPNGTKQNGTSKPKAVVKIEITAPEAKNQKKDKIKEAPLPIYKNLNSNTNGPKAVSTRKENIRNENTRTTVVAVDPTVHGYIRINPSQVESDRIKLLRTETNAPEKVIDKLKQNRAPPPICRMGSMP